MCFVVEESHTGKFEGQGEEKGGRRRKVFDRGRAEERDGGVMDEHENEKKIVHQGGSCIWLSDFGGATIG